MFFMKENPKNDDNNKESLEEKMPLSLEYKRPNGVVGVTYENEDKKSEVSRAVRDIIFTQDDGKEVSFRDKLSLPVGLGILEFQGFWKKIARYFPDKKTIGFSSFVLAVDTETNKVKLENFFEASGTLYVLLHEIGHVFQAPNKRYRELENLKISGEAVNEEALANEYLNTIFQIERDAHNFAIKKLRQLRREGIDLEPDFKTLGDIGRFVHQALSSYEKPSTPKGTSSNQ